MNLPSSWCEIVEKQFGKYCTEVINNELKNIYRERNYRQNHESLFSELSENDVNNISTTDEYIFLDNCIRILEFTCYIHSDLLFEALSQLSNKNRNVILLSYWLDMTDKEIGKILNLSRRNVGYIRHSVLKKLKKALEG